MRADGKRIKNADPMYTVASYVMDKRVDSLNYITVDIPVEPMQRYINVRRRDDVHITHMALVISAYLRATAEFPALNRFVVNKKIYARNEFAVGMVVLKPGDLGQGTMSKMYFEPEDTIFDVQRKIDEYIAKNRNKESSNSTDKLIKKLLSVPGLCSLGVGMFKFLDKHGMLPKKIIDASPFHATFSITNLASIRTNHIYHHIYEFGTTSLFIAMGNMRYVPKMHNGEIVHEKCLPLGIVMDERICSGAYFAAVFKKISSYLKDPTQLETKPTVIIHDEV